MAAPSSRPCLSHLASLALLATLALAAPLLAVQTPPLKVREPAVAGMFYPKDPTELAKQVSLLLGSVPATEPIANLKALVCPHAGYVYSGAVAARAYRQAAGGGFTTVVILAPSHTAYINGASVSDANLYRTPLGDTAISEHATELAKLAPFSLEPKCQVQRPSWWQSSRKLAPLPMDDRADTWEHSDEVQVPFIQIALPEASVLPVIMGDANPAEAARALSQVIDDKTLIVASSDLSHYHPYEEARALDAKCIEAICKLDNSGISEESACGRGPIRTLMELARQRGWKARLLDYRNSGDTAGDKSRVVGYAAIAFYASDEKAAAIPATSEVLYSPEERSALLTLARRTLTAVVSSGSLPVPEKTELREKFQPLKGCFVTLTKKGDLRGCIGHIIAQRPLYKAIMENARNAALEDPRFKPVTTDELKEIEIEISVLTEPLPLFFTSPAELLSKLRPHKDGVVLRIGQRGSTYLPQVWEQLPNKEDFLNNLSEKAGCAPSAWREPGTQVYTYQVENFSEAEIKKP